MRSKWLELSMMFVAVIALSAAVGACGGDGNECGPGTMELGDQCVPFCSDGEFWNGTDCVSAPACAAGTILNATTGECEPACADGTYWTGTACADVPTCGDGTQFNATTGECDPICTTGEYWDGTVCATLPTCPAGFDLNETTGECEALCDPGTFWDTTTETCLDACGEGTVLSDGVCMPWIDVVESDSMEPAENNDAMMGGMPGMLTLPAMDASMVLEGIIDSPTDLDGDGYDDADYDTWYFSATQGTRLRIEGWADGVFNVATLLIGASDDESNWWYQRYGLNPDSPESERDFVIPMDGEYLLAVTDFSNLTGDFPVGGPEMGYFVNITQVANPAPIAGTAGTSQTGSAFDIDQVTYTGTAGELWDVTIDAWSADVYGLMPVFNASGDFMQQLEGMECGWFGCYAVALSAGLKFTMPMAADGGLMFTADYMYRAGSGGDYAFTAEPNPNVEVLDVTTAAVHNEDLVSSEGEIIYQVDVVAGNLYNIAFENLGVDVTASLYATLHDVDFNFLRAADTEYDPAPWEFNIYAEVDARYYIRVIDWNQEAGSDYTYDLVVSSLPVEDLGILDANNTTITRAGAGPVAAAGDVFWFAATVDQAAAITVSFDPTVAWNLDFEIYNTEVQMLALVAEMGDDEAETVEGIIPAGTYLFRAYESGMDAGDSTYTFDIALTYDELQQEVEPNDDFGTANAMDADAIVGLAEAGGIDYFSYTVAAQGVLMFETGPGDANGDTVMWMYDTDGTTELAYNDDDNGLYSFVFSEVTAGTYYAAVAPYSAETNYVLYAYFVEGACVPGNSYCEDGDNAMVCNDFETGYEAEACEYGCGDVDGVDQCMPPAFDEVEPNNDFAGANEIVLDFDGYGNLPEADYDYYTFTLASDAIVTAETYDIPGGAGDTVMYLYDASEAELATNDDGGDGLYSLIAGQSLTAGTYFIMVRGFYSDFTGAYSTGYYGLTVEAVVAICTADATQCNVDGNLETCNAGGTAWDVTVCGYGCDDSGSPAVCNSAPPLINEVSYDQDGTDTTEFVEIIAEPGLNLAGYSLVHINGNGGAMVWAADLTDVIVPADGFLVLGTAIVPEVDYVLADLGGGAMQNGPDSVVLYWDYTGGAEVVVDAYGYEEFDGTEVFMGEGNWDIGIPYGSWNTSVGRYPDGSDSDDNATDFVQAWFATPGEPNLAGALDSSTRMAFSAEVGGTPVAIPDNDVGGVTLTMDFTGLSFIPASLTDLNVGINIAHTYRGDLDVILTAPDGTTSVQLLMNTWDSSDDYITAFDWGMTPYSGSMDDFNGLDAQGVWTLYIEDTSGGDVGDLVDWVLWLE